MEISEELKCLFNRYYEKAKKHQIFLFRLAVAFLLIIAFIIFLLIALYPEWQVSQYGITNVTEKADLTNQYRTTSIQVITGVAQILGGIVLLMGLYFAWGNLKATQDSLKTTQEIAQENIRVAQENQITDRFIRAVDQLGNDKKAIRSGGIYALNRIANESDEDYWPIMQVLTSFIRQKSPYPTYVDIKDEDNATCEKMSYYEYVLYLEKKLESGINAPQVVECYRKVEVPVDVQAAIYVISKRRYFNSSCVDLKNPNSHLNKEQESLFLYGTNLFSVDLNQAHLEAAVLSACFLCMANLSNACLQYANILGTNLYRADLEDANLEKANLQYVNLKQANLKRANLKEADLEGADLTGALNLSVEQLYDVKTLYNAKLDKKLETSLRNTHSKHFMNPNSKSLI